MILKEAYRYQKFLDNLIHQAENYLTNKDFITSKKETHLRNKVNPDAEDETIDVPKRTDVAFTPAQIIDFIVDALKEKEKLSNAIVEAKMSTEIDIDAAVAMNKRYQEFVSRLNYMSQIKSSEAEEQGSGYKFDVNGEQKKYFYTVKTVTTIDYDRNNVKKLIKKYSEMSDETSTKLDQIQINTEVNYEPRSGWELSSILEDIVVA